MCELFGYQSRIRLISHSLDMHTRPLRSERENERASGSYYTVKHINLPVGCRDVMYPWGSHHTNNSFYRIAVFEAPILLMRRTSAARIQRLREQFNSVAVGVTIFEQKQKNSAIAPLHSDCTVYNQAPRPFPPFQGPSPCRRILSQFRLPK